MGHSECGREALRGSRGETPSEQLEREWNETPDPNAVAPSNQLVAAGEWIFRVPSVATIQLVVHIVHFANGQLARCKCGLILDLATGLQVLPDRAEPPRDEQQCQLCWGIKPVPASTVDPDPEADRETNPA